MTIKTDNTSIGQSDTQAPIDKGARIPSVNLGNSAASGGFSTSEGTERIADTVSGFIPGPQGVIIGAASSFLYNSRNGRQAAICAATGSIVGGAAGLAVTGALSGTTAGVGTAVGIVAGGYTAGRVGTVVESACNRLANSKSINCDDAEDRTFDDVMADIAECAEFPAETMNNIHDQQFRDRLTAGLESLNNKGIIDSSYAIGLLREYEALKPDEPQSGAQLKLKLDLAIS